jgi:hypothetical protein
VKNLKEELQKESEGIQICTDIGYIPLETLQNEKSTQDFIFKNGIKPTQKEAGQLIISEKITEIELCDQYKICVRLVDLPNWKKILNKINRLSKKLKEEFKACLINIDKDQGITIDKIELIIDSITKPLKFKKNRLSGHLVDEKLKYKSLEIPSLFDRLMPETIQKIEDSKLEVKVEGIRLTPPENKLVLALNFILHEKSQNKNPKADDFYSGNLPSQIVPYGIDQEKKAAVLKFKPAELYKAFMGKEDYSGADIQYINNVLQQLESKKVLIKYDRIKKIKNGKRIETLTDRIEDFQSLIKIISFIPDLTTEEKEMLDKGDNSIREAKGEMVIALNPIFTDQIDTKFIEIPADTNRRLVIAAGGHNKVTSSMHTLMEWMLRDLSAGRTTREFNEENLPYALGLENYLQQGRKKKLNDRITKDIQAMTNMGILLEVSKQPNSTGGMKWLFRLNADYK